MSGLNARFFLRPENCFVCVGVSHQKASVLCILVIIGGLAASITRAENVDDALAKAVRQPSGAALFDAVTGGSEEAVGNLLDAGTDVRVANSEGRTVLHEAAKSGNAKMVRQLLDAGAKADASDTKHRNPLMESAAAGASDSVQLLIDAGADPAAKDADGKTALDLARAAKQDKTAALLEQFQKSHSGAGDNVLRPKAGEDLIKVLRDAKDGQVVVLSAGNYPGMIQVVGKSVIIRGEARDKTVLSGGDQAAVFVGEKARVELENLSIRTDAKTKLGVYVQNGEAQIRNCSFSGMSGNGCVANGGKLSAKGCDFTAAGNLAVYGSGGAAVALRDCAFTKCEGGVVLKDGESLGLFDCRFSDTPVAVQSRGQNASICARNNAAQVPAGFKTESAALDIEAGRRCLLTDNRFSNFSQAISITGTAISTAVVARNQLLNPKGGVYVGATSDGKRPSLLLIDNVIADAVNVGVLVDKAAQLKGFGNLIMSSAGAGVLLQAKSSATLLRNDIYAPKEAVGLREPDASVLELNANKIVGPIAPGADGVKLDDATKRFNAAAAKSASKDRLKGAAEKVFAALQSPAQNEAASAKAIADFSGELQNVEKEGAQFARLSLHITDITGQQFFPDFEVYPDRDGGFEQKYLLPEDIIGASSLLEKIRAAKDPVSEYLRDELPKDLQEQLKGADVKNPSPDIVEAVRQSLNELLKRNALYKKERFAKSELRPTTISAINILPSDVKASNRTVLMANRYLLEDAFPAEIASSRSIATQTANDRWASVSPGKYWLVPRGYARFAKQSAVKSGESLDVESAPDNALVLMFRSDAKLPPEKILLSLKPMEKMRATIAKLRRNDLLRAIIVLPRPGSAKEDVAAALTLARENLARCSAPPTEEDKKGLTEDQVNELQANLAQRLWDAERIFAVAGEEKEIELVAKTLPENGYVSHAAQVIGYAEARLGLLDRGTLIRALEAKDTDWAIAAATQLHAYGLSNGDSKLIDYVRNVPANKLDTLQDAAFALLDMPGGAVLEAMRNLVAQLKKDDKFYAAQWDRSWANPLVPVSLYLLAYGNKDDWRELTGRELGAYDAAHLAYVVEDVFPLARWLIKCDAKRDLARMSVTLRSDPVTCDLLAEQIENEVYAQAYSQSKEFGVLKTMEAQRPFHTYQALTSFWRPQEFVAHYLLEQGKGLPLSDTTWVAWPTTPETAKEVRNTGLRYAFEYFPHEQYLKEFPADPPGKNTGLTKLEQAAHCVTYRGFYSNDDYFHDGIERRPFVLVSKNPDQGNCAISGVLEVQPSLSDHKLRLGLRFRQQDSLTGVGLFPPENLKSRTALKDGGKSLLDAIRLRRGDHAFTINDRGSDEHGGFVYEAELDQADLTGIYLEIDLRFKDEPVKAQLVYDLFASDYARELRLKTGQKGTAKAGDVQQGGL